MSQHVPPSPIFAILTLSPGAAAGPAMAIEEAAYTLVRQYPPLEPGRWGRCNALRGWSPCAY